MRKNYLPEKGREKEIKRRLSGASILKEHRMREKYPEKFKARGKLSEAVRTGKIIRPVICDYINKSDVPCAGRIEAHHHLGYQDEHWKDVQWLCVKHHHFIHRKNTYPTLGGNN